MLAVLTDPICASDNVPGDPLVEVDGRKYLDPVADLDKMKEVLAQHSAGLAAKNGIVTICGGRIHLHQMYNHVQARGGVEKVNTERSASRRASRGEPPVMLMLPETRQPSDDTL